MSTLVYVLKAIDNKEPLEKLFRHGIEYSQFFNLLNDALDEGYLAYGIEGDRETDDIFLTQKGRELIARKKDNTHNKDDWIEPLENVRIESIKIEDVYVPRLVTIRGFKK